MEDAYRDGLKMLARGELSEIQVRQRLARRGHDPETIDGAVTRLKDDRAIDDTRVAETIVRTQTTVKHRGKMRVLRQLEIFVYRWKPVEAGKLKTGFVWYR